MEIKTEELNNGEVNVKISFSVLVPTWEKAAEFIREVRNAIDAFQLKRKP